MLKIILLYTMVTSCGTAVTVKGKNTVQVEGEATVKVIIDVSACNTLPEEEKAKCITDLIEILSRNSKNKSDEVSND